MRQRWRPQAIVNGSSCFDPGSHPSRGGCGPRSPIAHRTNRGGTSPRSPTRRSRLAAKYPARRDQRTVASEAGRGNGDDLPGRRTFPAILLDELGDVLPPRLSVRNDVQRGVLECERRHVIRPEDRVDVFVVLGVPIGIDELAEREIAGRILSTQRISLAALTASYAAAATVLLRPTSLWARGSSNGGPHAGHAPAMGRRAVDPRARCTPRRRSPRRARGRR